MIRLGVSLYPEQEKLEEIDRYLEVAAKCGFEVVFTSLFSVPGTPEEVIGYFKNFSAIAHKHGLVISGDCNSEFFDRVGATVEDLAVFHEMGIDVLRMDFSFQDERDAILINNKEGIKVEMSTAFRPAVELAIANGADPKRMTLCHNFYPQRYTAPSLETINAINDYWAGQDMPVAIFISSREEGTHGPWPVSDGLPTIEEHRNLPIEAQLKHVIALKNVTEARIGNAYASEAELMAIKEVMDKAYIHAEAPAGVPDSMLTFLPLGDVTRIPFKLHMDPGVTDAEREAVFEFPVHSDMDCQNYMLRSRSTRFLARGKEYAPRSCEKKVFTRGDVLVVNDNCRHYAGEVQIVLKDIENDGQRNYIGSIDPTEIMILDHMGNGDIFTFVEA